MTVLYAPRTTTTGAYSPVSAPKSQLNLHSRCIDFHIKIFHLHTMKDNSLSVDTTSSPRTLTKSCHVYFIVVEGMLIIAVYRVTSKLLLTVKYVHAQTSINDT